MVMLGAKQEPSWAVEVKWSDRYCDKPEELKSLVSFLPGDSDEAEYRFRKEVERHSGINPNSNRSEATLAF